MPTIVDFKLRMTVNYNVAQPGYEDQEEEDRLLEARITEVLADLADQLEKRVPEVRAAGFHFEDAREA